MNDPDKVKYVVCAGTCESEFNEDLLGEAEDGKLYCDDCFPDSQEPDRDEIISAVRTSEVVLKECQDGFGRSIR
jgi:hypothetical protein